MNSLGRHRNPSYPKPRRACCVRTAPRHDSEDFNRVPAPHSLSRVVQRLVCRSGRAGVVAGRCRTLVGEVVSLADTIARRMDRVSAISPIENRTVMIAVQGCGDWTQGAIQPDLGVLPAELREVGHPGLSVTYLDVIDTPTLTLADHERYWCLTRDDDRANVDNMVFDIVIIATPDYMHVQNVQEWRGRAESAKLILVEKPFSDASYELRRLEGEIEVSNRPEDIQFLFGLDHYLLYASDLLTLGAEIDDHLGEFESIGFSMTEQDPIEAVRLRSLQSGLIFDMGAHFLAIATVLGEASSLENPGVSWRGTHLFDPFEELQGRVYFSETAAQLHISACRPGSRIEANGRVGKAAGEDSKYVRLASRSGERSIRLDLTQRPSPIELHIDGEAVAELPTQRGGGCTRHGRIVEAIVAGQPLLLSLLLSLNECLMIVDGLEQLRLQALALPVYEPGAPAWDGPQP